VRRQGQGDCVLTDGENNIGHKKARFVSTRSQQRANDAPCALAGFALLCAAQMLRPGAPSRPDRHDQQAIGPGSLVTPRVNVNNFISSQLVDFR
jgi:hypothetical protein